MFRLKQICITIAFFMPKALLMAHQVVRITKPVQMGEGPHWDSNTKALYFVNMHYSEIHKYVPESNLHTNAVVEGPDGKKPVTFVVPVENQSNTFIIGFGGDLATVQWDGKCNHTKNFQLLETLENRWPAVRLNDAKTSPSGVLFVGSMGVRQDDGTFPPSDGKLYAYTGTTVKCLIDKIGIGNGLAWSLDESTFYYIDSLSGQVKAYDYNAKEISISNERIIYDFVNDGFKSPEVIPDGMTIDIAGNLWVAMIGSGKIYQIDPNSQRISSTVEFPACTQVTSAAFGGQTCEDLFITSAFLDLTEEQIKEQQNAGCLFKVTDLATKGLAGTAFKFQK